MPNVPNALLQQYVKLTEFLGLALGPDYEVALHDLTDKNRSIIAIANKHVSVSAGGKELRSSTMFIKQNGRLIGMLCINFDDSRYQAVSGQILSLCHPDAFAKRVAHPSAADGAPAAPPHRPETFRNSTEAVALDAISHELERLGVTAERLTSDERMQIIAGLEESGIFLLKGSVKDVAAGLCCSQASVYRYLAQIKKQ